MAANDNQNLSRNKIFIGNYTHTGYQPILHQLIKNRYAYTIYMEGATANKLDIAQKVTYFTR